MKTFYKIKNSWVPCLRTASSIRLICLFSLVLVNTGCEKNIEVDLPIDRQAATAVFSNTGTATAAMSGIYASMLTELSTANVSSKLGLAADELENRFSDIIYRNLYTSTSGNVFWDPIYRNFIYCTNAVIEGVTASSGIPDASKQVLLGEARFMRAFFYFYLVNMFGDVPLVLTTDYKTNSNIARSPKSAVYEQIISDLTASKATLRDNYLSPDLTTVTTERVRPNKAAATALLARVYLYTSQWMQAEQAATELIGNANYSLLTDINSVFFKKQYGGHLANTATYT